MLPSLFQGHIVTNYHVVASAAKAGNNPIIKVKLQGMPPQSATIVGYEPEKDLAVLRISSESLPRPIDVGSSSDLQVGQNVLAIGNPFGLDYTLTTGVVSALGRDVDGVGGRPIKGCIQSDAAINPGVSFSLVLLLCVCLRRRHIPCSPRSCRSTVFVFYAQNSGGPLLDSRGRLIGVNMAIYSPSGASAGIGFSIPVDTVRRVVNQIIRHGRVVRPTMGVNVADDRVLRSIAMQLRREMNGVLVVEVLPGSPAETAGLRATELRSDGTLELGDMIAEVDGEAVAGVEDLLSAIEARADGDTVAVQIWRKCDRHLAETVRVKLVASDKLKSGCIAPGKRATSSVGSRGSVWQ
jgi:S1-C subfamily serine protease